MTLSNIVKFLTIFLIISTLGFGVAAAAPSVTIDPASTADLSAGDSFTINVLVNPDGSGVSSGQIDLSFDTSVLEVSSLTKGDMLGTDAFDTGSASNNTAGTVTAVLARMGTTTPPTAAGTWATVTFNVLSGAVDGTTTIAITSVGLADEAFADITGITTTDGTVTVGAGTPTPSGPSVTIDPASTADLSAGDSFTVDVLVNPDGSGVSAGEVCLSFDASVLEVSSLTKGDMLGTDAFDTGSAPDNAAGTVIAVLARNGPTTPPTAAGTWATVTFNVLSDAADGTTTIAITSVGLVDGAFADITGITTTDGTVTVGAGATTAGVDSIGIYRDGAFYLRNTNDAGNADIAPFIYGMSGDTPLVGNWNNDGTDTIGIYRNGAFYLRNTNDAGNTDIAPFIYGMSEDIPLVGDWNNDGTDTIGIYRDGAFYLRNTNDAGNADIAPFIYGMSGDIPLVGDWNNDGTDTIGIYRDGAFYLRNTNDAGNADIAPFIYGMSGDTPIVGDWNNDGTDTIGIYRNGAFYLRNTNDAGNADIASFIYGMSGDTPLVGDWNGI